MEKLIRAFVIETKLNVTEETFASSEIKSKLIVQMGPISATLPPVQWYHFKVALFAHFSTPLFDANAIKLQCGSVHVWKSGRNRYFSSTIFHSAERHSVCAIVSPPLFTISRRISLAHRAHYGDQIIFKCQKVDNFLCQVLRMREWCVAWRRCMATNRKSMPGMQQTETNWIWSRQRQQQQQCQTNHYHPESYRNESEPFNSNGSCFNGVPSDWFAVWKNCAPFDNDSARERKKERQKPHINLISSSYFILGIGIVRCVLFVWS